MKCVVCGKPTPPLKYGYKPRQTCSNICWRKLIVTKREPNIWRGMRPETIKRYTRICPRCGETFFNRHLGTIYCSRKCAFANMPKGEKSWAWKGGRTIMQGYVLIYKPEHPAATKDGYVREHRLVIEEHIGRLLKKGERVHHVNGNRGDNRLQNLQLLSHHCHIKCPFCGRRFNPPQGTFI